MQNMKKISVIIISLAVLVPSSHYVFADDTATSSPDIIIDASSTEATTTDSTVDSTSTAETASSTDDTTSTSTVATSIPTTVHLDVRYEDSLVFDGDVTLPDATTTTLDDSSGAPHSISSDSALYLLSLAQASSSNAFSISDLQYYTSFGEFYINCLDIQASSTVHACSNWQYAVNGSDPAEGSDQYIATIGDNIYFYYGNQRQFTVSATSTDTATPVTVSVQKYDYTNNSWLPLSGEIVDATQPNPNDEWNPFIIATSTSDASGTASFLLANAGVYNIGLSDDGFYPTTLTVSTSTASSTDGTATTTTPPPPVVISGGGGGSGGITHNAFDLNKALQFISSNQSSDGSFGGSMYTDWVAIALASLPDSNSRDKIVTFIKSEPNVEESVTDYERHAMALEALGINPYNGTSVNYIQPIVSAYDGTEIGDPTLVNNDIFAIFPLMKAGYSSGDPIIQKTIAYIISEQNSDGSWAESVDLTSAAIQALSLTPSIRWSSQSIHNARQYLVVNQQADGGFGSVDSTSWALQAIASLNESSTNWLKDSNDPQDYLYNDQQSDGGIDSTSTPIYTRIWSTAYAIPAASNKTWASIFVSFPEPSTTTSNNGGTSATHQYLIVNQATSTPIVQNPQIQAH